MRRKGKDKRKEKGKTRRKEKAKEEEYIEVNREAGD